MKAYKLVCPCLLGVEGLVAEELRDMGAENVAPENGRVVFDGSPEMIARANIRSRYAEPVSYTHLSRIMSSRWSRIMSSSGFGNPAA